MTHECGSCKEVWFDNLLHSRCPVCGAPPARSDFDEVGDDPFDLPDTPERDEPDDKEEGT